MFDSSLIQSFLADLDAYQMSWNDVCTVKKSTKPDKSPVTEIDQGISNFFKTHPLASGLCFYSEEDFSELSFPALILDPLDGTKELLLGRPECATSAAWMHSADLNSKHFAIIKNPFTGFTLTSMNQPNWISNNQNGPYFGLVSRSEWEMGLDKKMMNDKFQLAPRGSIAFKLGLLASGACDFVVSMRPKNIWDIAAGTLLAHQRGMEFWSNGKKVTELSQTKFEAPLIWAPKNIINELTSTFFL